MGVSHILRILIAFATTASMPASAWPRHHNHPNHPQVQPERTVTHTVTMCMPTDVLEYCYGFPTYTYTSADPIVTSLQNDDGNNPILNAINAVFGLSIESNAAEDACAARQAAMEPVISEAHKMWYAGDHCNGGIGVVWSSSPDPQVAASMWLGSAPHAAIIRSAQSMACGSGPSSAVCIAYG